MPLQNRVLPTGDIVATPARGTVLGNRGILHDATRTLESRRWQHQNWVCCVLSFKGRRREVMAPRRYTELFFLDEAVAFAAGHRPCGECRRAAYHAYLDGWQAAFGDRPAPRVMDKALHRARVNRDRSQVRFEALSDSLPDGVFILWDGLPHLVHGAALYRFGPAGYAPSVRRPPCTMVTVLTPAPTVAVLQTGYAIGVHPSATIDVSPPKA
ncbi:hypothetical protein SAMN04488515_0702 [Cognatiyoonia koreensis]|uniref:Metal binding domain of Ada n=1 Tax=Cognatiyoonia koreensis TaxID=364200 RepID=A0A1I0NLX2_9RHOB|nr:hypothetical protein [Cognatiyoonia koreensis]SEW02406.1 hypothetical protein SAMN04488515_0702 [Cognatiyoonia koreensis]